MKNFKSSIITASYLFILSTLFTLLIYNSITINFIIFSILESIIITSIIELILTPLKEKVSKFIRIILISIITVFFIAQYIHYNFYDCFFSVYSLVNGGQVFGFIGAIVKEALEHITGIVSMLVILTAYIVFIIKTREEKCKIKTLVLIISLITSIAIIIGIMLINTDNKNEIYTKENLLNNTNSGVKNNKNFGLPGGMLIDLYRYNNSYNESIIKNKNIGKDYNKQQKNYNITDINFNKIKTNNNKIKKINNYIKEETPTNKNKYTGVFKNKNLIFITAESLYFKAINKETTPTLYKMQNSSLTFTNFYTPIYYASTSDGEYTNLTGLLPKEGTWSYLSSQNKTFPYTYANILKEKSYKTHAYHNGKYNFYNRNLVMPTFGYEKYTACGNGLEKKINCNIFPQSDEEMLKESFNDYKNDKQFMTYYMTISTHLPHNFNTNNIAKKHKKEVNNLNYSNATKAYISATIDLDKALNSLIKNLEKEKLLENTVIVIVPDHFPYGLSNKELNEIEKLNNPYDKYKSGLIIYNPEIKQENITKYASNIDILPTILNMFDIKYDSRLLVGKDIMSDAEGIVIFNDRSFLTNKGYYNEKINKFTCFTKECTSSYIKNKRIEVFNKTNISSMILESNYYKAIEKEIK